MDWHWEQDLRELENKSGIRKVGLRRIEELKIMTDRKKMVRKELDNKRRKDKNVGDGESEEASKRKKDNFSIGQ